MAAACANALARSIPCEADPRVLLPTECVYPMTDWSPSLARVVRVPCALRGSGKPKPHPLAQAAAAHHAGKKPCLTPECIKMHAKIEGQDEQIHKLEGVVHKVPANSCSVRLRDPRVGTERHQLAPCPVSGFCSTVFSTAPSHSPR